MKSSVKLSLSVILILTLTNVCPSTGDELDAVSHSHTTMTRKPVQKNEPTKIFAAYRESYITKDDAKKFRQRIKNHKKPYVDKDYEDLVQEIHFKPKQKPKQMMYEKKYFDYLPADMIENAVKETKGSRNTEDSKVEFLDVEEFAKKYQALNKTRRTNSRRMKRSTPLYPFGYSQEISLFDTPVYYHFVPHTIIHRGIHPNGYYQPSTVVHHVYPQSVFTDWSNQPYLPPKPDRGYLPGLPGQPDKDRNPGMPPNNPRPGQTLPETSNRFGEDDVLIFENAKDDRPKFGVAPKQPQAARPAPTRPPLRTTPPSLFHNSNDYEDPGNSIDTNRRPAVARPAAAQPAAIPQRPRATQRTTTKSTGRTPPPLFRDPVDYDDDDVLPATQKPGRNPSDTTVRPPQQTLRPPLTQPTTTTPRPATSPSRPSQCTWAIVNCCTSSRSNLRYSCFESHGCSGFFFGVNPCTDELVDAAMAETERFFNRRK